MKFHTRTRRMPQVMIVSLIDIFAILLIFVIVTTTFKTPTQPSFAIKLPESKTAVATETPSEPIVVAIAEDARVSLNDVEVPIDHLLVAIKDKKTGEPERQWALKADTNAPFGTVIKVIDVLKEAGVKGNLSAFMDNASAK
jgi:biopolymer transport protein ExbD